MEQFVKATLDNTAKIGNEIEILKSEVKKMKADINTILDNQKIINENILKVLNHLKYNQ
ncbi:hypothetical protein SAMN05421594_0400 [Chryseobacterium oleae]|uniref:Uncharacterized protein n=1 Tax=Chryseobacterium oleae TaxID=491207 RepID=A0A1I4VL37_CHROL|nr:hypothetical protein [Chryseobacterium oleae]SFN01853.1 hypothetical protein SAMN05421594_0400 [Chryseobacterium oleae]